jgi:hypothetical protein
MIALNYQQARIKYQKGQEGLMKDSFWSWKTLFIIRMHRSRPFAFDNNETETIFVFSNKNKRRIYQLLRDLLRLRAPAHIMFGFGFGVRARRCLMFK